jgi:hypothetical protein
VRVPPRTKLGLLTGGVRGIPTPLQLRLRQRVGGRVRRARAVARGALLPPGRPHVRVLLRVTGRPVGGAAPAPCRHERHAALTGERRARLVRQRRVLFLSSSTSSPHRPAAPTSRLTVPHTLLKQTLVVLPPPDPDASAA